MNGVELDDALHRALEHVFQDTDYVISTFRKVLTDYPLEKLESADDDELDAIVGAIKERKDVQEMQRWIDIEISAGEETLDSVVLGTISNSLPYIGVITQNQLKDYSESLFQEIWIMSNDATGTSTKLAMGIFPASLKLDEIVFRPENVFYSSDVQWNLEAGKSPSLHIDGDYSMVRAAKSVFFQEKIDRTTAKSRVRGIVDHIFHSYYGDKSHGGREFLKYENKIVDSLRSLFPSILNQNRSINYENLYHILSLARRDNINLEPYVKDSVFCTRLMEGIEKFVPLPYAVIRTRTKQRDRAFDKIIEVFYNITTPGSLGEEKSFRDMYGIRVILPTEEDVYRFVTNLKRTFGISVVTDKRNKPIEKDYIKNPKPNGYQSYHIAINFASKEYDLQLRTHDMDFAAEMDPKQAHEGGYIEPKNKSLQETPWQVRRVIGTLLGLDTSYLKPGQRT